MILAGEVAQQPLPGVLGAPAARVRTDVTNAARVPGKACSFLTQAENVPQITIRQAVSAFAEGS